MSNRSLLQRNQIPQKESNFNQAKDYALLKSMVSEIKASHSNGPINRPFLTANSIIYTAEKFSKRKLWSYKVLMRQALMLEKLLLSTYTCKCIVNRKTQRAAFPLLNFLSMASTENSHHTHGQDFALNSSEAPGEITYYDKRRAIPCLYRLDSSQIYQVKNSRYSGLALTWNS